VPAPEIAIEEFHRENIVRRESLGGLLKHYERATSDCCPVEWRRFQIFRQGEGDIMSDAPRKPPMNAAESETLCMHENSLHGNRETLETPSSSDAGRSGNAYCRTPDMHVSRESDGLIVPKKRANKAGPMAAAESVEGRGPTKGKGRASLTRCGHSAAKSVASACLPYEKPSRRIVIPKVRAV